MAFESIKKRFKDWDEERKLSPSEKAEKVAARRWEEMERLDKESKEIEARNRVLRDSEADLSKAKARKKAAEQGEHREPLQVEREAKVKPVKSDRQVKREIDEEERAWQEHDRRAPKVHHKRYPTPKLKRAKRTHHKTRRTSFRRLAERSRPVKPSKPFVPNIAVWGSGQPDIASWGTPKSIGGFKF